MRRFVKLIGMGLKEGRTYASEQKKKTTSLQSCHTQQECGVSLYQRGGGDLTEKYPSAIGPVRSISRRRRSLALSVVHLSGGAGSSLTKVRGVPESQQLPALLRVPLDDTRMQMTLSLSPLSVVTGVKRVLDFLVGCFLCVVFFGRSRIRLCVRGL